MTNKCFFIYTVLMLNQKYNYKKLKRENIGGKRHYIVDGNDDILPMASVTTILDATKPEEDKQALLEWKKAVGYQKAQAITTEASSRGTRMHAYLETYIKTGQFPTPGTNPYAIEANEMARVVMEQGLCNVTEVWGTEIPLCHPDIYAGTTDLAGLHMGDEAIMDFKQTNKPKTRDRISSYFLQLTAYGEAHNILYGTNIRKGVIMMCTKDKQYQEFIIEGEEYDEWRREWWRRVERYFEL